MMMQLYIYLTLAKGIVTDLDLNWQSSSLGQNASIDPQTTEG